MTTTLRTRPPYVTTSLGRTQAYGRAEPAGISSCPPQERSLTGLSQNTHLFGSIVGSAVGWYCGIIIVVPVILSLIVGFIAYKAANAARKALVPTAAVNGAQVLWIGIGFMVTGLRWPQLLNLIDIAWLTSGLAWLWIKPSRTALVWLALYQLGASIMHVSALMQIPLDSFPAKALVANLDINALAIVFLVGAYKQVMASS